MPEAVLQTLFQVEDGTAPLPLPEALDRFYGPLSFDGPVRGPHIIANFVSTMDGIVSLDSGHSGGSAISGKDQADLMLMGLLRAVADVVIEGSGTLHAAPGGLLTAAHVWPGLAEDYAALRQRLGKPATPLNVIVSEHGDLDLGLRIFQSGEVDVLILSTAEGVAKMGAKALPARVTLRAVPGRGPLDAQAMVAAIGEGHGQCWLLEGGPHLFASFLKGHCLHEMFLTLAPQIAGRAPGSRRPGFAEGQCFAPADARWGRLLGIKKAREHLFLRYAL